MLGWIQYLVGRHSLVLEIDFEKIVFISDDLYFFILVNVVQFGVDCQRVISSWNSYSSSSSLLMLELVLMALWTLLYSTIISLESTREMHPQPKGKSLMAEGFPLALWVSILFATSRHWIGWGRFFFLLNFRHLITCPSSLLSNIGSSSTFVFARGVALGDLVSMCWLHD